MAASATRLGLTSFGGPVAHLGYFRREYVERRGWLDDATFADLVGLCQALPGPASSQLGIAIGARHAGPLGGLVAWLGFTLPSAALLLLAAGYSSAAGGVAPGLSHGLALAATAIVAQALFLMARRLTPDLLRLIMAALAAAAALLVSTPFTQLALIVLGGLAGWFVLGRFSHGPGSGATTATGSRGGAVVSGPPRPAWRRIPAISFLAVATFLALLLLLPLLARATGWHVVALVDAFYRSGALVFGGGHVVLPLLQASVVDPGWVGQQPFLAGYGLAQAAPGPLFSFAAFLGAVEGPQPNGLPGAVIALLAIYLPSFFLLTAALPTWDRLRGRFAPALAGVNAVVVGVLAAALVDPLWTSAVHDLADVAVVGAALGLLVVVRAPPILVVALAAGSGLLLGAVGG